MALGRVVPARRAIAATSSAREGEKARNMTFFSVPRGREKLIVNVFLLVDHDSDLQK